MGVILSISNMTTAYQEVLVDVGSSESFLCAGYRQASIPILPSSIQRLGYNFVPVGVGHLGDDEFRCPGGQRQQRQPREVRPLGEVAPHLPALRPILDLEGADTDRRGFDPFERGGDAVGGAASVEGDTTNVGVDSGVVGGPSAATTGAAAQVNGPAGDALTSEINRDSASKPRDGETAPMPMRAARLRTPASAMPPPAHAPH